MGFIWSVVVAYAGFAAGLAANTMMARILDLAAYGDVMVGLAAAEIVGYLIVLGGQGVVQRFMPLYLPRGDYGRVRGMIEFYVLCCVLGGAGLAIVTVGSWAMLGRFDLDHLRHEALIAVAIAPLIGAMQLFEAVQQSSGQPVMARVPRLIIRPLSLMALTGLWLMHSPTLTAMQAIGLIAVNRVLTIALQLILVRRALPFRWPGARRDLDRREWVAVGLPMLYAAAMNNMAIRVDILSLEAFHSAEHAVGAFSFVTMIAAMCWMNYGAVTKLTTYRLSRIENDGAALNRVYRQVLVQLGTLNVATALGVSVFARQILDAMHPDLGGYAPWLVFAVWGAAVNSLLDVASQFVRFAGLHRLAARWSTPLFATHVAVTVGAVLAAGIAGAFVSLVAMRMLRALAFLYLGWTRLGLRPWPVAGVSPSLPDPARPRMP